MERGDSDEDGAMAYFLPNGITDDSPPKRSTLGHGSFGPIGARFGGFHQPSPRTTTSTSLFGNALSSSDSLTSASTTAALSTTRPTFLLSDLGGEIHEPRANDAGIAIGGGRHANPFAFSGAFGSSDSIGRAFENPRGDLGSSDLFPSSSSTGLSNSSLYGQPTLNANAPVFMASSQPESLAMNSSSASPSGWPTTTSTVSKPRRAPPGLSKPTEDLSPVAAMARGTADKPSGVLSHPPGLSRPSPFGGVYSTASSSSSPFFSDTGAHQFSSSLQPHYASLSDPFMSGVPTPDRQFKSALSQLNSKSMSVEEVQSSLAATAIAAAHDVVDDADEVHVPVATTPRRAAKSPRQTTEFGRGKPPHASGDDKRKGDNRTSTDPRLRTPTRRTENNTVGSTTPGAASPAAQGRRGRNTREPAGSETPTRGNTSTKSALSSKTSRRARGAAGGHALPETRPESRDSLAEAIASGLFQSTPSRKKPPSSISSVGSDDQLVAVSTLIEVAEERTKVKESPRELRSARNTTHVKTKTLMAAPVNDKRAGSRRQVYREKHAAAEVAPDHSVKVEKHVAHAGSDADASGGESQTDDATVKEPQMTKSKAPVVVSHKPTEQAPKFATPTKKVPTKSKPRVAVDSPAVKAEDTSTSDSNSPEKLQLPVSPINTPAPQSVSASPLSDSISGNMATENASADFDSSAMLEPPSASVDAASTSLPQQESDSGSEIPESIARGVRHDSGRKISSKEQKKDKKKDKTDKKKTATSTKANKKEKRDSSSSGKGDLVDEESFSAAPAKKSSPSSGVKVAAAVRECRIMIKRVVMSVWSALWFFCTEFADRINLKGFLGWSFSYIESFLAVVFSVVLLLSLHGASWFIRIHRVAFRAVLTHRHVGFCFAFLYAFPYLVQYVFPWAPPWAPVCLWYAFLVQLFCTSGPTAMVATFRIIIPLLFVVEGISHHSFLLDLNGAELLLASFILSAMKTSNLCSPIFLLSLAIQCLSAVFLGSEFVVQWFQMALALYSLHAMAATDEDWAGLGDEEDDVSCRPMAMHHHSIADYNYNPVPSAPQIQKTKRLDRRALAYVRGRKLR